MARLPSRHCGALFVCFYFFTFLNFLFQSLQRIPHRLNKKANIKSIVRYCDGGRSCNNGQRSSLTDAAQMILLDPAWQERMLHCDAADRVRAAARMAKKHPCARVRLVLLTA
jgi:hypothetical protein